MSLKLHWKLKGDGKTLGPTEVVNPDERMSWGYTAGLGIQHVAAMVGATFVFPIVMGLNPQLALLMSGVATIIFLLIVKGKVPSYLGTSAVFVGGVAAIRADGGTTSDVTGAILVAGGVLALAGFLIHLGGANIISRVLPASVSGAIIMVIGFGMAPLAARQYWPQDQWVALATLVAALILITAFGGVIGRIAILVALVFGTGLSWVLDRVMGPLVTQELLSEEPISHLRWNTGIIGDAAWFGLPPRAVMNPDGTGVTGFQTPSFSVAAILLLMPAVIALIAENAAHIKAVASLTGTTMKPHMGRAIAADGIATMVSSSVGGPPTTTYAENIGVMAATRVYSTAAYYAAALFAIALGLSPKVGALAAATPAGVLGGVTVVLYGMIGLLGAKMFVDAQVDLGRVRVLAPLAAGLTIGIGDMGMSFAGGRYTLPGIALGTLLIVGGYHGVQLLAAYRDSRAVARAQAQAKLSTTERDETGVAAERG